MITPPSRARTGLSYPETMSEFWFDIIFGAVADAMGSPVTVRFDLPKEALNADLDR